MRILLVVLLSAFIWSFYIYSLIGMVFRKFGLKPDDKFIKCESILGLLAVQILCVAAADPGWSDTVRSIALTVLAMIALIPAIVYAILAENQFKSLQLGLHLFVFLALTSMVPFAFHLLTYDLGLAVFAICFGWFYVLGFALLRSFSKCLHGIGIIMLGLAGAFHFDARFTLAGLLFLIVSSSLEYRQQQIQKG